MRVRWALSTKWDFVCKKLRDNFVSLAIMYIARIGTETHWIIPIFVWFPGVLGYFMGLGYWVLGSWGSGLRLSFVSQQKNKSSQRKREINAHDSLWNNVVVFCLFFKLYTATHLIQKQWFSDCAKKNDKTKNKSHKWKNKLCTEVTCQCFANMTIIYFWELCNRN